MKEKIKNALEEILYTNLEIGRKNDNRCVTAANRILSDLGIRDIQSIFELSKVIEDNCGLEIDDREMDKIYDKCVELVKSWQSNKQIY